MACTGLYIPVNPGCNPHLARTRKPTVRTRTDLKVTMSDILPVPPSHLEKSSQTLFLDLAEVYHLSGRDVELLITGLEANPDLALTVRAPGGPGRGDVRLGLENWAY
jgi:hypothetical protein